MIFSKNHGRQIMYLQFKPDPLPTDSADICLFHPGRTERFEIPQLGYSSRKVVYYFRKMGWQHSVTAFWWLLHKTTRLFALGKWIFRATKRKTSSCNIVLHPNIHMHAQYRHRITNYAAIQHITFVSWTESHETSNMIGHFVKVFWRHNQYTKFDIFPCNYVT